MACGKCETCKCGSKEEPVIVEVPEDSTEELLIEVPEETGKTLLTESKENG